MKTIGLIGGMSWESTLDYYKYLNEGVKETLGGLNSAKILLYSYNFSDVEVMQHTGDWDSLTKDMVDKAIKLQEAGADIIAICTNTMHKMAPDIEKAVNIPLIHIADATGTVIKKRGQKKVGLLGTNFTMNGDFYRKRIKEKFDIEVIVPNEEDKQIVHNIIYDELCKGVLKESSKSKYIEIIEKLAIEGAEGVILGCTEIPLLIKIGDTSIPVYDTTKIHSDALLKEAIK
jgi:aspartate racemase